MDSFPYAPYLPIRFEFYAGASDQIYARAR